MLKVEDVMTRDVITVKQDTPIYEAMEVMRKHDITGMPVIDDDMTLVGVITEKDVLRLFCCDEDDKNKTVGFFMTRPAVSYRGNESLQSVCDFMMVNYFRRVPVISKKGKLIGIISRPDIIDYIIEQRQQNDQTHSKTSCISSAT
ncbi:MAG: CBS domain-containing protein [Planctomycetes bacterium]|nr:CBS domain-containing protein [Planctomycetota bacterium]MBL7143489.1 CBS domain-containing protein [Phycisphaerae bacterium]